MVIHTIFFPNFCEIQNLTFTIAYFTYTNFTFIMYKSMTTKIFKITSTEHNVFQEQMNNSFSNFVINSTTHQRFTFAHKYYKMLRLPSQSLTSRYNI